MGRLGQLKDLQGVMEEANPEQKLRTTETDWARGIDDGEKYIQTEDLIQILAALTPDELWLKSESPPNKVYTYSAKAKCLRDFQDVFAGAEDANNPDHERCAAIYRFYLDIAPQAWNLYKKWKAHPSWIGMRIRLIKRTESRRKVVEVPDGLIFPILAALSLFANMTRTGWRILPPKGFDEEIISAATVVYRDTASSNPTTMGKSKACYSSVYQIGSIFKRLAPANA